LSIFSLYNQQVGHKISFKQKENESRIIVIGIKSIAIIIIQRRVTKDGEEKKRESHGRKLEKDEKKLRTHKRSC
jgi:hypothetical protein